MDLLDLAAGLDDICNYARVVFISAHLKFVAICGVLCNHRFSKGIFLPSYLNILGKFKYCITTICCGSHNSLKTTIPIENFANCLFIVKKTVAVNNRLL